MIDANGDPLKIFGLAIFILFFYALAIFSTFLRLAHRFFRRQLYWDDFWACIALLAIVVLVVRLSITFTIPLKDKSILVQSFLVWIVYFMHPVAIWAARLSIGVTILRFFPPGRMRNLTLAACVGMGALGTAITIQKVFMCEGHVPVIPYAYLCTTTVATAVLDLVSNCIANLWLIFWPAWILLRLRLPTTYRRLLLACFSASLLVGIINVVHDIYLIRGDFFPASMTGHIDTALALFLCNMLVLVSYIYRVFREPPDSTYGPTTDAVSTGGLDEARTSIIHGRRKKGNPGRRSLSLNLSKTAYTTNDPNQRGSSSGSRRYSANQYPLSSIVSSTGPLTSLSGNWEESQYDSFQSRSRGSLAGSEVGRESRYLRTMDSKALSFVSEENLNPWEEDTKSSIPVSHSDSPANFERQ